MKAIFILKMVVVPTVYKNRECSEMKILYVRAWKLDFMIVFCKTIHKKKIIMNFDKKYFKLSLIQIATYSIKTINLQGGQFYWE